MSHQADNLYMSRAIQLAKQGAGLVSPNPMVGCVIVHNDRIIGEGYHHQYGGPHAEVEAVNAVSDKEQLKQSTAYVTLEPCSHFGKTPPCSDLLISHQLKRVVIANIDPNPLVQGAGIDRLLAAGIEVVTGVKEKEAAQLNRRFFTYHRKKRPYVVLKWAQTSDGFIARSNFDSKWISGVRSRQLVHRWRSEEAAILVGKNTALHDDPGLTTRDWHGKHPLRVVLDPHGSLASNLRMYSDGLPVLRMVSVQSALKGDINIPVEDYLHGVLSALYDRNIQSILVEGGTTTINKFIELDLWDEARVFVSPQVFDRGIAAPCIDDKLVNQVIIGSDQLFTYENPKAYY